MAEHAAAILILALWFGGWGGAAYLVQWAERREREQRIRALYPHRRHPRS